MGDDDKSKAVIRPCNIVIKKSVWKSRRRRIVNEIKKSNICGCSVGCDGAAMAASMGASCGSDQHRCVTHVSPPAGPTLPVLL